MTLVELLVAMVAFLMLVAALVALASAALDSWSTGEERKDTFDRAQRILDQVSDDLRNVWGDDVWVVGPNGQKLQHAYFACDSDANKRARIRFVRSGSPAGVNADPEARIRRPDASVDYTDLWEIAYVADPDPEKPVLHRGVRFFDRNAKGSLLTGEGAVPSAKIFRDCFRPVDTGVLWMAFRFWTPSTDVWALPGEELWVCPNRSHPPFWRSGVGKCPTCDRDLEEVPVQPAGRDRGRKEVVGPSTVWDSSRRLGEGELTRFLFHRSRPPSDEEDFCYPEIVQVTVVIESQISEIRGTRLTQPVSDTERDIRLDSTRAMPDGPDFVKIGPEWIEYSEKTVSGVKAKRRGVRGTAAVPHGAGERARYGETFTTDVRIPAYREAVK